MQGLALPLFGQLDLSQIASRIGWEFMKLSRGEVRMPSQEVAKLAQELFQSLQAAEALVAGREVEDFPGINNIPTLRRRMLVAEADKRDVSISTYKAIRKYALKQDEVIQDVASGKREPTTDELCELREHFALLSLVLEEAGL
jgi:hypothetical protein